MSTNKFITFVKPITYFTNVKDVIMDIYKLLIINNMKERILELMSAKSLTAMRFAEIMDVGASSISHILSGRNNPSYDFIVKILNKFPEISSDWLLIGSGDMYKATQSNKEVATPTLELNEGLFRSNESSGPISIQPAPTRTTERKVTKVILLYSDGSFDSFDGDISSLQM